MDVEKIKQRLKTFQEAAAQKSKLPLWRPPAGKSTIRIVPYKFDKDNQFVELYFYFKLFGKTVMSPTSYGEADPIAEFSAELMKTGAKEDFILGKKLEPRLRIFTPIVVRGSEEEGVKYWGFGTTVRDELMEYVGTTEEDYTNPSNGRDIIVKSQTPKEVGNKYGKISIIVSPKQTPLTKDSNLLKTLLEEQRKIDELYHRYSYEDLNAMLKKYLEPENEQENESSEDENESTEEKGNSEVVDATSAFDEVFGK